MFVGGIDLPDEKRPTLARAIEAAARPQRLLVPLAPCAAAPAEPAVKTGERVQPGQRIGIARDSSGVDVFAPLGGRVESLCTVAVARWGGFAESPAIELADLSDPGGIAPPHHTQAPDEPAGPGFDWQAAGADELLDRITQGQITTHRFRPQPLAEFLTRPRAAKCRWTILNALDHEPYVSSDHRLLAEFGPEVMEGLAIIARIVGSREVIVAADHRRTSHYQPCNAPAERLGIARIALPHKYPMGADTILTKVLTRREAPPGRSPLSVGTAMVDAPTCLAVHQWVVLGRRVHGRVVTVAGSHTARPGNFWAPFGTPCAELASLTAGASPSGAAGDSPGPTLVHGGPMAGILCDGRAVVTPATGAVLSLEVARMPLPGPCIRCGWCTDHCPARLNVAMLNDAFELSLVDRAASGGALACVECGVCSYICPAKLPLTQRVKQLKRQIVTLRRAAAGAPPARADEPAGAHGSQAR
jgi:electron transport complex protein RnfC